MTSDHKETLEPTMTEQLI